VERRRISDTNASRYADGLLGQRDQGKHVDALASYQGKALTILASFASMPWHKELRDYALAKIRQIVLFEKYDNNKTRINRSKRVIDISYTSQSICDILCFISAHSIAQLGYRRGRVQVYTNTLTLYS
jgi:hypothetical protein